MLIDIWPAPLDGLAEVDAVVDEAGVVAAAMDVKVDDAAAELEAVAEEVEELE